MSLDRSLKRIILHIYVFYHHRNYVEFGVENGDQCNTRVLREHHNFTGLLMDGGFENEFINLRREFLTIDNIVELFQKYNVPPAFDLLSIDLDMFDFWILEKILKVYSPRVIVAEVNPTLGHNICRQSHKHFMQSFWDLNAIPLVANHPYTMEQQGWDGTRYSGANPLAFQLLTKEFGYEMVYCESCGVNCFFVLKSLMPTSCPVVYPTPRIHYPCYGTGEQGGVLGHKSDPLGRSPVILSPALVRQIMSGGGALDNLITSNFSSHLLRLDERISIDRSEMSSNVEEMESSSLLGEADLACDCFHEINCASRDNTITAKLELFQTYFDTYAVVTQPRQIAREFKKTFPSYAWTCHLIHNLKNSTLCADLASLYYHRSLYFLQVHMFDDAKEAAALGLKFNLRNKNLMHLMNYFHLCDFIMASKAEVYALAFVEILLNNEVKVIGIGAGVCDNIRHRTQHHYALASHHLTIYELLAGEALQQCFGGFLSFDDGYTHAAKSISFDMAPSGSQGPYYSNSSFFSAKYIHSCFSQTVFKTANEKIDQICEKRNTFETFIVFSPPFSGSEHIKARLSTQDHSPLSNVENNLSQMNSRILQYLGCEGAAMMWTSECKQRLQDMARGFLPQALPETNRSFWKDIMQSIYQERVRNNMTRLVLSDPLFSFTSPLWKEPLGTTQFIIPLSNPAVAINCWSKTENISKDTALSHYIFYFSGIIDAAQRLGNDVLFVKHSPMGDMAGNNTFFSGIEFAPDIGPEMDFNIEYSRCDDLVSAEDDVSAPIWLQECVDAVLRDNSAAACILPMS